MNKRMPAGRANARFTILKGTLCRTQTKPTKLITAPKFSEPKTVARWEIASGSGCNLRATLNLPQSIWKVEWRWWPNAHTSPPWWINPKWPQTIAPYKLFISQKAGEEVRRNLIISLALRTEDEEYIHCVC
jgi:hypothetical protein